MNEMQTRTESKRVESGPGLNPTRLTEFPYFVLIIKGLKFVQENFIIYFPLYHPHKQHVGPTEDTSLLTNHSNKKLNN